MKKVFSILLASAMMLTLLAGCGDKGGTSAPAAGSGAAAAPSGKTQILTIGTADSTGTMYPVGAAVASVINDNVPGFKVNVETSKGSPANCVNIQSGEVQLATIAGDTAAQAVKGEGKFDKGFHAYSSNSTVASVDADGTITAKATGTASVTFRSAQDASKTAVVNVTVN